MKCKLEISYNWKCNQGIEIPEKHKDAIKEDAMERIFQMVKENYFSGELSTSVRYGKDVVPEEDENEGLTYIGWWSVKEEEE